ncbi:hypothetical protein TrVGV298_004226 [Trichoderma virens]|nr:hypothetical protein TrVGV298_004226 [Trichoderma virens]
MSIIRNPINYPVRQSRSNIRPFGAHSTFLVPSSIHHHRPPKALTLDPCWLSFCPSDLLKYIDTTRDRCTCPGFHSGEDPVILDPPPPPRFFWH